MSLSTAFGKGDYYLVLGGSRQLFDNLVDIANCRTSCFGDLIAVILCQLAKSIADR
jgi:hypothetical protein